MMTFPVFFLRTRYFLEVYECQFFYQRKNCKKHGHFKKKINRKTGIEIYEIRIEKEDNHAAKVYTYAHELAHMINRHLDTKSLTYAQQEWVAHHVGMYFIEYFGLERQLVRSKLFQKFNVNEYANMWLRDKVVSDQRFKLMQSQVEDTVIAIRVKGGF
jgi:hypothetical protein